eukprot:8183922-Pyramimonas_sp.AAC.1
MLCESPGGAQKPRWEGTTTATPPVAPVPPESLGIAGGQRPRYPVTNTACCLSANKSDGILRSWMAMTHSVALPR